MATNGLFLNDTSLERYLRGQARFTYPLFYNATLGDYEFMKSDNDTPVALYEKGKATQVVLTQANIDNFLGEAGVFNDSGFVSMPSDDTTFGIVCKFAFDVSSFLYSVYKTDDYDQLRKQPRDDIPLSGDLPNNRYIYAVKPLSAGGFALAGIISSFNFINAVTTDLEFRVIEFEFVVKLP